MPVMVTAVLLPVSPVRITNATVVAPSGTTTSAGTMASEAFDVLSAIDAPPAGAGAERTMVALTLDPPWTVDEARAIDDNIAGGATIVTIGGADVLVADAVAGSAVAAIETSGMAVIVD